MGCSPDINSIIFYFALLFIWRTRSGNSISESWVKNQGYGITTSTGTEQPLSSHEEPLYPPDSRCVSYILNKVKSLESYENSYCKSKKGYCFCNPLEYGLESGANGQDKIPYAAFALIFDCNKFEDPIVHNMNKIVPNKESEARVFFEEPMPQDQVFAKVLVNSQYVCKDLADSLNNLLNANTTRVEYLMDACNKMAVPNSAQILDRSISDQVLPTNEFSLLSPVNFRIQLTQLLS